MLGDITFSFKDVEEKLKASAIDLLSKSAKLSAHIEVEQKPMPPAR
ncbi:MULTISPECIES: hypothetical protein [Rhizobium]|nr:MULTISPECIES: hypothetical protein [Rhizobium]MCA0803080.1 hypothetical protein [Rhizobium sp. T1473]MCS0460085.1 hypothetical protein [Rhizobium favelukesii]UFS83380.1 hypothetical protein LPB79_14155 [Rhizobium sp. T136]